MKPILVLAAHPFDAHHSGLVQRLADAGLDVRQPFPDRRPTIEELLPHLRDADHAILATIPISAETLAQCPRLKLVARTGVGLDGLDLRAFAERGVLVTHTPGSNTNAVSELTIAFMIDGLRGLTETTERMRRGVWRRSLGPELRGRRVGLLGFGRVGRRVAELLRPFDCDLVVRDILEVQEQAARRGTRYVGFDELIEHSEVLSLHVPLTPLTKRIIDAEVIARLPEQALLINAARGGLVDEAAVLASLESGQLGAAAFDVYEEEPYAGPLRAHPHVIMTSHMGACTHTARREMETRAVEEVLRYLRGEPPVDPAPLS